MSRQLPGTSTKTALLASAGLNVVLLAAWAFWPTPRPAAPTPSRVGQRVEPVPAASVPSNAFPEPEPVTVYVTNRFHWRQLETEDYSQFVANLRAVGCPERTIRDILSAEIGQAYARKKASLKLPVGFWSAGRLREEAERARKTEALRLEAEKSAVLERLVGPGHPWDNEMDEGIVGSAIAYFILGPLPGDVADRALSCMVRGERLRELARERTAQEPVEAEERAVREALEESFKSMQAALNPVQWSEFQDRLAAVHARDNWLGDFTVTSGELHGIARIHREVFGSPGGLTIEFMGSDGKEATEEQKELFRSRVRQFLGDHRYAQLKEKGDGFDP